jgi:hypothetical protein
MEMGIYLLLTDVIEHCTPPRCLEGMKIGTTALPKRRLWSTTRRQKWQSYRLNRMLAGSKLPPVKWKGHFSQHFTEERIMQGSSRIKASNDYQNAN